MVDLAKDLAAKGEIIIAKGKRRRRADLLMAMSGAGQIHLRHRLRAERRAGGASRRGGPTRRARSVAEACARGAIATAWPPPKRKAAPAARRVAGSTIAAAAATRWRARIAALERSSRPQAVEVAVAIARKLAPELAGARAAGARSSALATECLRDLRGRAASRGARDERRCRRRARPCSARSPRPCGFDGRLVVLGEPDIALGDCRIEWADGGIAATRARPSRADRERLPCRRTLARRHARSAEPTGG